MLANISNFWLLESSFSEWSNLNLVGGLEHEWIIFPIILGIVAPTDFHILQRGRSTTNQQYFHDKDPRFIQLDSAEVLRSPRP